MTPPEDQNGQFGVAYPGAGQDAFGVPDRGYTRPEVGGYGQATPGHAAGHAAPGPGYGRPFRAPGPQWSGAGNDVVYRTPAQAGPMGGYGYDESEPADEEPLIRPYAMTGGRTRPRYQLAIEALVSTTADPDRIDALLPEHQRICGLCREVKSVAEVSALLSIPLGVARILVADLAESGLVAIHQPAAGGDAGGQPDVTLLERVLSGLRKL
jgi:hypothetical protein